MVGIPGSGKTTLARTRFTGALRVSFDDIRLMLTGQRFQAKLEPIVQTVGLGVIEILLDLAPATGYNVLLDATNVTKAKRKRYVEMAKSRHIEPVAVFVKCDLATARSRNRSRPEAVPDYVLERMYADLEPPTLEEGFTEVIEVDTSEQSQW